MPKASQLELDPLPGGMKERTFVMEGDAEALEKMRKQGNFSGFTIYCDEGPHLDGDGTAPRPLDYFLAAICF